MRGMRVAALCAAVGAMSCARGSSTPCAGAAATVTPNDDFRGVDMRPASGDHFFAQGGGLDAFVFALRADGTYRVWSAHESHDFYASDFGTWTGGEWGDVKLTSDVELEGPRFGRVSVLVVNRCDARALPAVRATLVDLLARDSSSILTLPPESESPRTVSVYAQRADGMAMRRDQVLRGEVEGLLRSIDGWRPEEHRYVEEGKVVRYRGEALWLTVRHYGDDESAEMILESLNLLTSGMALFDVHVGISRREFEETTRGAPSKYDRLCDAEPAQMPR